MNNLQDDITLELARIERECLRRIQEKMAAQQLGEAWKGIENENA